MTTRLTFHCCLFTTNFELIQLHSNLHFEVRWIEILNLYLKVWDYMSYKLRIHKVRRMNIWKSKQYLFKIKCTYIDILVSWKNWEINAESSSPAYFCNWQAYVEPKQKILLQCKGFRINISEEVVVLDFLNTSNVFTCSVFSPGWFIWEWEFFPQWLPKQKWLGTVYPLVCRSFQKQGLCFHNGCPEHKI